MSAIESIPKVREVIRAEQSAGASMRAAMHRYRQGGGQLRTEDFAALWRDEQRKAERGEQ